MTLYNACLSAKLSLSLLVSAQTQQELGWDPQVLPWRYTQQKSGGIPQLWAEVSHLRSAQQPKAKPWPSEALNRFFSCVLIFTSFLLGLQLRSCLQRPQDFPAGLSCGFCLPWGPSVLHWVMMCREGTQGRSPPLPGPWRRVTNSGPRAAPGRLDHFSCSCPWCPAQPQAAKPKEDFLGWSGILGFRRERRMMPHQPSHPPPPLWWKVGSVLFLFLLLSPLPKKSLWLTPHHMCSAVFLGSGPPHENKNNPSCFSSQLSCNIRKCSKKPGMYFNSDHY